MAAVGFGSAIGSVVTARLSLKGASGKLIVVAMLTWPVVLVGFALSRIFGLSLALLVIIGFGQGISMALIQSLMLVWSSDEMRGRVSGIRTLAIGLLPMGNFLTGAWAGWWGATPALIVDAAAGMASVALVTAWAREILRRK
jgi:MFS family permease